MLYWLVSPDNRASPTIASFEDIASCVRVASRRTYDVRSMIGENMFCTKFGAKRNIRRNALSAYTFKHQYPWAMPFVLEMSWTK